MSSCCPCYLGYLKSTQRLFRLWKDLGATKGIIGLPKGIFKGYIGNLKVTKMLLSLPRVPLGAKLGDT